jgi:hypothetical protein
MSKSFYNLYDKICHPLNIWWAYKDAVRGKRYQPVVASFEYDLEKNLIEIEQELKDETYQMGGYHSFRIEVSAQFPGSRFFSSFLDCIPGLVFRLTVFLRAPLWPSW